MEPWMPLSVIGLFISIVTAEVTLRLSASEGEERDREEKTGLEKRSSLHHPRLGAEATLAAFFLAGSVMALTGETRTMPGWAFYPAATAMAATFLLLAGDRMTEPQETADARNRVTEERRRKPLHWAQQLFAMGWLIIMAVTLYAAAP